MRGASDMLADKTIRALAGVGLTLMLLSGCGGKDDGKTAAAPKASTGPGRAVTVGVIQRRPLQGGVTASGLLVAREEAAVSAEVAGFRVSRVLADVGQSVAEGQVLVELDDSLLKSQIDQQTAMVSQAEVAARQAAASAQRVSGLDNSGAIAKEQIDQRRFQAESSQAALAAQRAGLRDLQVRAGKMQVKSPVAGVVLEKTVRQGDQSGGGQTMFRIARGNLIELSAEVPESALRGVQPGASVTVTLPSGQSMQGRVRIIEPVVQQQTHQGLVRIILPVRPDLRPGGSATAQFTDLRSDVLSIKETALRYDADGVSVFVVDANNRVHAVPVEAGRRAGGYVELTKGPPEGSRVLLGATSFVLEGDVVNPVPDGATVAPKAGAGAKAK